VDMLFNVLAAAYVLIAIGVIRRLRTERKATFDDTVTPADRRFVYEIAFFLLTPPAVALHELGHAVATWVFDGRVASFWFAFYWGSVLPVRAPPFSPAELGVIAGAGPLVSLLLGFGAVGWVLARPGRPARNLLLLSFGELQLFFGLVFYPAISLPTGFGDFHILRTALNAALSHAGDAVVVAYVALAVAVVRYRGTAAGKRRRWELTSHNFADLVAAEQRLAEDPDDPEALKAMGYFHLGVDDSSAAVPFLERAAAAMPADPTLRYNLAVAKLGDQSRLDEALADLREAQRIIGDGPEPESPPGLAADIDRLIRAVENDPAAARRRRKPAPQSGSGE
jgi:hypothetical protein